MLGNIEKIWRDFTARPFPYGCTGLEIKGIELASLDSFTAGCIDTFVANNGRLDAERIAALRQCAEKIDMVVPNLEGEAIDYFEQLQLVSNEVLRVVSKNGGH